MKPFWISWYTTFNMGGWELHSPWWISGTRFTDDDDRPDQTICAAVMAKNEDDAMRQIRAAYDKQVRNVEWRFCEEKPEGWAPFSDRFPRAKWMKWPGTAIPAELARGRGE